MNYKMLVTTFKDDIKQFKMFCYCLNKNWQGQKDLIVCLGYNDDEQEFANIIKNTFDVSWNIEIKPTIHAYEFGVTEQQVNTVFYSILSGADDVIVWDCKDFLLRPCNFSTFKKNDKYRITYLLPKKLVDMGYNISGLVDTPIDHIQAISNIRPWIWNIKQLTRYWEQLTNKFGNYQTWKGGYPAGNEIYGYYVYTLTDSNREIKFLTHPDMPLLFGGGWTHQTYDGILKEADDFDQSLERIVWKHSRKLKDPRCLEVTKLVLLKHGIDKQFIDQVYG